MEAVISKCGTYRYVLRRKTGCPLRWVHKIVFVMLNPSTADATKDDPTIRRCLAFALKHGFTDLSVVNLFALRSTDPFKLVGHEDAVGPENDEYIRNEVQHANLVVAAWGARPFAVWRANHVLPMLGDVVCLGKTKDGYPRHPLYVKGDQSWMEFKR